MSIYVIVFDKQESLSITHFVCIVMASVHLELGVHCEEVFKVREAVRREEHRDHRVHARGNMSVLLGVLDEAQEEEGALGRQHTDAPQHVGHVAQSDVHLVHLADLYGARQ
eukprot:scaffold101588_cov29-Prasinocladus_malaysianus.AAC.2